MSNPASPLLGAQAQPFGTPGSFDALSHQPTAGVGALDSREVEAIVDTRAFVGDALLRIAGSEEQPQERPTASAGTVERRTIGARASEYKKTCIAVGILIALTGAFLGAYFGSGDVSAYLNGKVFHPIHAALGTGGGLALATILGAVALRYLYRGANYLFRGIYIAEREKEDIDLTNLRLIEINKTVYRKDIHARETASDRMKENWFKVSMLSLLVIGAIVLPIVFTQVHGATTIWNEKLWPALNHYAITPVHQHLGDVGGIMVGSAVGLLAMNYLYQLGKYWKTGKYLANVQIQAAIEPGFHSHTWFAVSKHL
jgi:hypothetical protein